MDGQFPETDTKNPFSEETLNPLVSQETYVETMRSGSHPSK